MNEVIQFFTDNPIQFFATVGLDGRPSVRPFQYMLEQGGKLYFCTGNDKTVYKELVKNPYVQICSASPQARWVRVSGKAVFSSDIGIKDKILEHAPLVRTIYKNSASPTLEIFYLDEVRAVFYDFSGNPPKEYTF
ncbi:MAG: pyridoxamine 5'-phosphate oxidase family protein [Fusobacteriaceae bacterium]|jgi:uncharacterized pyridoxamine 5'-phosphate oxidase family protein|nr:pyridoxamine 5'-phosphate oxidase family protein [Fusobacteriaceae bacterium]